MFGLYHSEIEGRRSPLMDAAAVADRDLVELLLRLGARVDEAVVIDSSILVQSPLHEAISCQDEEMIRLFLEHGEIY